VARYIPQTRTEIARLRRGLDDEITRAEAHSDLDVRGDAAKYCCMRVTGFLEQALLVLGIEHVRRLASGTPQNFALSFLDKSSNPTAEAVLKYVGRFDPDWGADLHALLEEDERGQDLNALVGTRNQIAHGRSQGISIQRVKQHRANVDSVIDFLVTRFDP
jgi:hypothetical protein